MAFDAKKVKDDIIKWIRDWFEVNGKGCNAIVAISGGKDSSVVAALCVEALGKEGHRRASPEGRAVRYRRVACTCGTFGNQALCNQY